jgi:hypothetical protein
MKMRNGCRSAAVLHQVDARAPNGRQIGIIFSQNGV